MMLCEVCRSEGSRHVHGVSKKAIKLSLVSSDLNVRHCSIEALGPLGLRGRWWSDQQEDSSEVLLYHTRACMHGQKLTVGGSIAHLLA